MRIPSSLAFAFICTALLGWTSMLLAQTAQVRTQNAQQKKEPAPKPVPIEDGKVILTAKNTTIQFIGTHIGPKPDPRVGHFTKFTGELAVDEPSKAPSAVELDIDTGSLVTPIAKLTGHLHSPDFFDVRQYPKATFASKNIEAVDASRGKYKLTGELTIREVKKPISFPATVKIGDEGVVLTSKFKIKRSEFGMNFGPDRVEDDVVMTVTVGRPTPKVTPQ